MKNRFKDRFRNYPQPDNYIPDNYPKCKMPHKLEIMCGELAKHTFEVPLNLNELEGFEVIYKHGIKPVVIKDNYQAEYIVGEHGSIINCTLYPHETALFSPTWLSSSVQLKFYDMDYNVTYSEIYKIEVSESVESNRKAYKRPELPKQSDLIYNGGYGFTTNEEIKEEDPDDEEEETVVSEPSTTTTTSTASTGKTAGYGYTED